MVERISFCFENKKEFYSHRNNIDNFIATKTDPKQLITNGLLEAMNNAFEHGDGCVSLTIEISESFCKLIIRDKGSGFNFDSHKQKNKSTKESFDKIKYQENGRGLLIIRSVFDTVEVNNNGNEFILLKRL